MAVVQSLLAVQGGAIAAAAAVAAVMAFRVAVHTPGDGSGTQTRCGWLCTPRRAGKYRGVADRGTASQNRCVSVGHAVPRARQGD